MSRHDPLGLMGDRRPSPWLGALAAVAGIALTTAIVFPLEQIAPVTALVVVYLVAVLVVSIGWGAVLGICTAVGGALAFNWFHLPPTGRFTIADAQNWVALAVFFVVAIVASSLAEAARHRTQEAEQRRREADLAAELARLLLRGEELDSVLPVAAQRLAGALGLPSAAIELRPVEGDERRVAFPLREDARQLGTLLLPADLPETTLRRAQERVVPPLEALLGAAMERDELLGDVVETRALRRSDVIKTALLRSVSHDLRTPITAIVTAAEPLAAPHVDDGDRRELARGIQVEARRLSKLIENLLDLSRLEADAAEPRPEWCSVDEVLEASIDDLALPAGTFNVSIQGDLPLVRADSAQLERAFSNLLENAARHSGGHPVSLRARAVGQRVVVRVVDRGPGIPSAQRARVFEPFYRSGTDRSGHRGSGLGLAIARGFVEANGGTIAVESLPGQGTTFVVEFPSAPVPAPVG
jgi:two-component system, OmpR family, sensor histidine kinase KdpD